MMDVFEAVRTLVAVRSYRNEAIPAEVVERIVEAGRLTGSSMNKQPWHFIVVQEGETLHKLGALARSGPYVAQAPLAIVVAGDHNSPYAMSDVSRAVQSMTLTAWADGVGSNWVGFSNLNEINELLAIPADIDVIAIIPFGYPDRPLGQGKKNRKPLSEVASRERFGQPFS